MKRGTRCSVGRGPGLEAPSGRRGRRLGSPALRLRPPGEQRTSAADVLGVLGASHPEVALPRSPPPGSPPAARGADHAGPQVLQGLGEVACPAGCEASGLARRGARVQEDVAGVHAELESTKLSSTLSPLGAP